MTEPDEVLEQNRREGKEILEKLLSAPAFPFDINLKSRLPVQHGVYVISRRNGTCLEYLHAGRSNNASGGLRSRIWAQHVTGGGDRARSDLVQKVIDRGLAVDRLSAQAWIKTNCFVQWAVEENDDLRCWAEHYILSVLRPSWGR
jgi:hypothetical protein